MFCIFWLLPLVADSAVSLRVDPTLHYNTTQLIQAAGYPVQLYDVVTKDGYLLRLFRMAVSSSLTTRRPPVLLMHGMTVASDSWLLQGPQKDLAYMLYDAGYDVWLGDVRGNFYSRRHARISPSSSDFWQFSFHEIGIYDLPAIIDTIGRVTGIKQLSYIGHSMGTTAFFVLASERPELMANINIFVGLAPVAAMDPSLLSAEKRIIMNFVIDVLDNFKRQKTNEIFPRVNFAPFLATLFCKEGSPTQDLCYDLLFFWAGNQAKRISRKTLPRVLSHVPAGLSLNTPLHFLQVISTGRFQWLDYGPLENQRIYKNATPPEYHLSRVTCPVALQYSLGDYLINATDVKRNIELLPQVVDVLEHQELNHIDFVWGRTAWRQVYPHVINVINRYNSPHR